jgi:protein-S-isoprenylcysteine O-methyltransferase Ste14
MNALKTIVFLVLVPGFMLGVVPVLVIPMFSHLLLWSHRPLLGSGRFLVRRRGSHDLVRNRIRHPRSWHSSTAGSAEGAGGQRPVSICPQSHVYRGASHPGRQHPLLWDPCTGGVLVFLLVGFNFFIHANEEPHLGRTFGTQYEAYCHAVPRWVPKFWKTR